MTEPHTSDPCSNDQTAADTEQRSHMSDVNTNTKKPSETLTS
jgi:hypothetical protein